jgi:CHAT domain-containing protein
MLAASVMNDEEATPFITHAATCGWCGPRLKEAMHDLADDITAEEQEALAKLPSASPGWQRTMARELAAAGGNVEPKPVTEVERPDKSREKTGFRWWPKLVWAGPGLAVLIVGVLVGIKLTREPDVNQLLAQAYTEQRTIELRMPGANYGPMRVERGSGNRDLPVQFYVAEGTIKRELAKHPEDPNWLQAQARAHMLEWNYEKAIQELDDALMLKPNDPGLLTDKATALFQRAEKIGPEAQIDYGQAVEDLSQVLKKSTDDSVALFNRAILYEKLHLPNAAIADWQHYLRVDPEGAWSKEAHERIEQLKKVVKAHEGALAEPLTDPLTFAALAKDEVGLAKLDDRIEEYQDLAIREWLPKVFSPDSNPAERESVLLAVHGLGNMLVLRHHDSWMNDLLAKSGSLAFAQAIFHLGEATVQSASGNHGRAYAEAENADRLFVEAGSRSGSIRAELEVVHSFQRSQKSDRCLSESRRLRQWLDRTTYHWMRAQIEIEQSGCSAMAGRFELARSYVDAALIEAEAGQFPVLQLRALGISAAVETDEGNLTMAWEKNGRGLQAYWKNPFAPPMRVHQFYDDLMYAAEDLEQWNLATSLAQEDVQSISLTADRPAEAMIRERLAKLAIRAENFKVADRELARANEIFSTLLEDDSLETYRAFSEIDRAEMLVMQDDLQGATQRLMLVKPRLKKIQNFQVNMQLLIVSGMLLEKENRFQDAKQAFREAASIVEKNLGELTTDFDRSLWTQETSKIYRSLVGLEMAGGNPTQALSIWEWYRSLPLRASIHLRRYDPLLGPNNFGELLLGLKDRTVLSYAVLPQGLAIWSFDQRGLQSHFIPRASGHVLQLSMQFAEMCSDSSSDLLRLRSNARVLYDELIAPVSAALTNSTIVIEADGPLERLPFEALLMNDDRYLGTKYRVVFSPGLLFRHQKRSSPIRNDSSALIIASSVNSSEREFSLEPINVAAEAQSVAQKFKHSILLAGHDATKQGVEMYLSKVEVFHYVGHAISDVRGQFLLLMPSGPQNTSIWSPGVIKKGWFQHCKLVVLSACSTAGIARSRREVRGGFVHKIILAGVPNIVASRWNIESQTATVFMDSFYSALLAGNSPDIAFHRAEENLLKNPESAHPYFWASFILMSET